MGTGKVPSEWVWIDGWAEGSLAVGPVGKGGKGRVHEVKGAPVCSVHGSFAV